MARGVDDGRTRGASCVSAGKGGCSATWRAGRESEREDRTLPNADSERLARRPVHVPLRGGSAALMRGRSWVHVGVLKASASEGKTGIQEGMQGRGEA